MISHLLRSLCGFMRRASRGAYRCPISAPCSMLCTLRTTRYSHNYRRALPPSPLATNRWCGSQDRAMLVERPGRRCSRRPGRRDLHHGNHFGTPDQAPNRAQRPCGAGASDGQPRMGQLRATCADGIRSHDVNAQPGQRERGLGGRDPRRVRRRAVLRGPRPTARRPDPDAHRQDLQRRPVHRLRRLLDVTVRILSVVLEEPSQQRRPDMRWACSCTRSRSSPRSCS